MIVKQKNIKVVGEMPTTLFLLISIKKSATAMDSTLYL